MWLLYFDIVPIKYTNRRGETYYLYDGETKTGRPIHYFSMKAGGTLAKALPCGFEIYESPRGQVFLRKILPKLISDDELAVVEREVARFARLKGSRVERKLRVLTVYVADRKEDSMEEVWRLMPWRPRLKDETARRFWSYEAQLQFVLVDDKTRLFQARRYCYRGRIDDWIDIGELDSITALAKLYILHLEQESYFELF